MWHYSTRRVLQGLLVLFLVSFLVFSLVRILPGDAILMQLDQAAAVTPENLEKARQELGRTALSWSSTAPGWGECYGAIWAIR